MALVITQGPHCEVDATTAVPEPYQKQLLHLISCERCRELHANHFSPSLQSFKRNLFTRWPSTFETPV